MKIRSILLLIAIPILCRAQDDKCIIVDVSHSVDTGGKKFIYSWELGDGTEKKGTTVEHCYKDYGTYLITLNLLDPLTGNFVRNEMSTSVVLTPTEFNNNFDGVVLNKSMDDWAATFPPTGRFTDDVVHLIIINKAKPTEKQSVLIIDKTYDLTLQHGNEYLIFLYKGNIFYPVKELSTQQDRSQEAAGQKLAQLLRDMQKEPPQFFPPVMFALNEGRCQPDQLAKSLELLKNNPKLTIEVGVYTHTGGRIAKNIVLAEERTAYIKQYLTQQGVTSDRVSIATPETRSTLLNTCYDTDDCTYEDESLNRSGAFRITGINY